MSDHPELENSVAAFVLGSGEEEEVAAVRAHLAGCAECRELASRLQRAADALPLATDLVEPPARLLSRILAAAAASPRPHSQPPTRTRIVPLGPSRTPGWARARRWRLRFPTAAVAALGLAVLALGAWNLHLEDQLNHQQAAAQVASTTLVGSGPLTGVRATVLDFRGQSVALLTFSRMPAPAPGKVYEVWLIPGSGAPVGVAVFQPDPDGGKTIVVTRDIQNYKVIAVTVEQGPSGASAPTQSPSLAGNTV